MYYLAFPEDRPLNKILVYGVYFLETVQAILLLYNGIPIYNFRSLISTYELPEPDSTVLWTAVPLLGGIGMFSKMDIIQLSDSSYQQSCLHRPIVLCIQSYTAQWDTTTQWDTWLFLFAQPSNCL
jgi:hypothetical protein